MWIIGFTANGLLITNYATANGLIATANGVYIVPTSDQTVYHTKGNTDLPIVDWNPPDGDESWEDDGR